LNRDTSTSWASIGGDGTQLLTFVNREVGTEHEGTQTQEVLRAVTELLEVLIDRTNHCHSCLPWEGNARIVQEMSEAQRRCRRALLLHEHRGMERRVDKVDMQPEKLPVTGDGHVRIAGEGAS